MKEYQSLSHTRWDCKYHVVFIPKRRKKRIFGVLRRHLGEIFHELAVQKESKRVEGHLMADPVHMCISIPPKYAVSNVVGYIKGKSAIAIARRFGGRERNFTGGVARHLGIEQALGPSRQARLVLWQVIARVIDQGSRLSAVRLAAIHAACDVLGLERFDEEDLYGNLDWLSVHQAEIEDRPFQLQPKEPASGLFLYDVTSSYLEGERNELAAFGYNRDGKRGKRQLVIGLLCNGGGRPLSIEVFAGNTQDPKTFTPQVKKVAERFGGREITFVGDRAMIKTPQIESHGRAAVSLHHSHHQASN